MGETPDAMDLSTRLSKGWFSGRLGTGPLRLRRFLAERGYPTTTACTAAKSSALIQDAPAGILLFLTSGGLHYVAFKARNGDHKLFYNVSDSRKTQLSTLEQFHKNNAKTSFCYLMVPA